MSDKLFTQKEIETLRNNPYTYSVTERKLSFTKEFKEIFWDNYLSGVEARDILEDYGYPADVLGEKRIKGITQSIKNQYYSSAGIHQGLIKNASNTQSSGGNDYNSEIKALKEKVELLRQEVNDLIKLMNMHK